MRIIVMHNSGTIGQHARLGENNHLFTKGTESLQETLLLRNAHALMHEQMT